MSLRFARSEPEINNNVRCQRDDDSAAAVHCADMDQAKQFGANLKAARIARGMSQERLASEAGVGSKGYISDLERGVRPIPPGTTLTALAEALKLPLGEMLQSDIGSQMVPVIGRVGANPDDSIIYTTADDAPAWAPLPPGGTERAVGLEVVGHSMRWVAEDGALIYFEQQRNPPSENMLGDIVIVETEQGQVLVKRLLRGSKPKLFDLESQNGPTIRDCRVAWAAEITAVIPPKQARRIIRREDA